MFVYKIGLGRYIGSDRNSGLYEYKLIKKELSKIDCDDVIIVVNGMPSEYDKEYISCLSKKIKVIFVATDEIAFTSNAFAIDRADLVLHQSTSKISSISKRQKYSFVPELFLKDDITKKQNQLQMVMFAGANSGREEEFEKYKIARSNDNVIVSICKEYNADGSVLYDDRVDYESYCSMLSFFKYSLVICRKSYNKVGWITSRMIEAFSYFNLPLLDNNVDKNGYLEYIGNIPMVSNYYDLVDIVKHTNEKDREGIILNAYEEIKKVKHNFRKIIEEELQ